MKLFKVIMDGDNLIGVIQSKDAATARENIPSFYKNLTLTEFKYEGYRYEENRYVSTEMLDNKMSKVLGYETVNHACLGIPLR